VTQSAAYIVLFARKQGPLIRLVRYERLAAHSFPYTFRIIIMPENHSLN